MIVENVTLTRVSGLKTTHDMMFKIKKDQNTTLSSVFNQKD